jgi:hypothetical protein
VDAERPLAEEHADDSDDRLRDLVASASGGSSDARPFKARSETPAYGPLSYSAARSLSAGAPAWAKWFVPLVKASGTTIEVSRSRRARTESAGVSKAAAAARGRGPTASPRPTEKARAPLCDLLDLTVPAGVE